ncbi:uncharacterized protein LOC142170516 [Nicotiana tabacum]|uniref:Uncharacterized protein LOC142170516 n=1 Tax=Nicotiana tabacum TaxID=4097 RepID=A0AC58SUA6_TOBAC
MGDHNTRMHELRKEVNSLKGSIESVTSSVAELQKSVDNRVAQAMDEIRKLLVGNLATTGVQNHEFPVENERPEVVGPRPGGHQPPNRDYHTEFPVFDGVGLKDWLYKCEQIFAYEEIPEDSKVRAVSCKLEGRALQWHQSYMKHRVTRDWPRWGEYVACLYARFGSELFDDPMGDLKDLRQVSSVQDYVDLFDELLTRVELSEEYVVSCFIRGLKPEIGLPGKMLAPRSLAKAISLARIQEQTLIVQKQVFMIPSNPSFSTKNTPRISSVNPQPSQSNTQIIPRFSQPSNKPSNSKTLPSKPTYRNAKRLTPAEMEERRSKGLCYNCDEKYSFGHVCKNRRQLFSMEVEEDLEGVEIEQDVMLDSAELLSMISQEWETDDEGSILPHGVKGKVVQVLIDTGSTHNFLDLNTAKKLGCVLTAIGPFDVSVANGKKVKSNNICKKLMWKMQGVSFDSDMLVLPIGGCSMVLGIQWLITLGDIMWNFKKLRMEFNIMGHKVSLRGIQPPATKLIQQGSIDKLLAKPAELCMISVGLFMEHQQQDVEISLLAVESLPQEPSRNGELQAILQQYSDLFEEPKQLPPPRLHDHKIILKEGTSPINIRPYKYPNVQKNEIEKMVNEMLDSGIIRNSTSPYSSPIVMVKKKDGSWHLCVDYRELNSYTVKDKFPIPVIEELLDELHGAKYFSKLDLRAGYHQIRIKFILVFFDDILIYSQSWTDHLVHLEEAFKVLRSHTLFIKQSKCAFGVTQIHYLGHIISGHGVSMDNQKVQGVLDWPLPSSIKGLRGFLGLTGYYRRFIKGYGIIARPLTDLLKKGNFQWNVAANTTFEELKRAITSAPVLALPDFSKTFTVETDASGKGIGAVLAQNNKPIAFFSKGLSAKNRALSVYERELLALISAVQKWRPYLLGRPFTIRTDHHSLKYLLEQRITTPSQQKWLVKLLGYDYSIDYKKGKENVVADALSRREEGIQLYSISNVSSDILESVKASRTQDLTLQQLIKSIQEGKTTKPYYRFHNGILSRKNKLVIGTDQALRTKLLSYYHDSPIGGHSGITATLKRLKQDFYWKKMKQDVYNYIRSCDVCQKCKNETVAYPG